MKWIDYHRPTSVDEAVGLLGRYKDKARILAGGTDLLVQMRGGRYQLDAVIDGKHIAELNEITHDPVGGLTVGASVPCYRLYQDQAVASAYPGLMDSATLIRRNPDPGTGHLRRQPDERRAERGRRTGPDCPPGNRQGRRTWRD